jgi:hypothetical protein
MTVKYEDLMKRREELVKEIKTWKDKRIIEDRRAQIIQIDRYILKYYPDKVVAL